MDKNVPLSGEENNNLPKNAPIPNLNWFFLGGAAVFILWAWATAWLSPIIEQDINQHRRNTILPTPQETSQIRQTFTPNRNGLTEVEVKLAREAEGGTNGRLELQLLNETGEVVTAVSLESSSLVHEQNYVLRFDPQPHSAGQTYTLLASGTANNDFSLWGYDLDVHSGGQLSFLGGETAAQDLYLITRYRLTLPIAAQSLWRALTTYGPLLLLALAYILLPGSLILTLTRTRINLPNQGFFTRLAIVLALGLCLWPILWQYLSLLGLHWSSTALWLVLIIGWAVTITLALKNRKSTNYQRYPLPPIISGIFYRQLPSHQSPNTKHQSPAVSFAANYALLALLLLAFAARFLAVRDLAFPPWVDASRHGLITAVMTETGQVIDDYQPYLDVDRFPYHYGFHTISAGLAQMTDHPLPELLLGLGQLLNSLVPLTIYAAAYLISHRRWAGWTAAFFVALPFFFPAYYATWGRMTQLTGVIVLPILLALTWKLVRGAKQWRGSWWLVSILAAGLFLIHFRVFLLYVVFAGIVWLFSFGRNGRRLIPAGILALLLIAPRVWQLLADANPARAVSSNLPGYNDFPVGYVTVGWERPFLILGGVALLLAVIAVIRRRQWAFAPLFLVIWAGVTAVLLSGSRLGLPETSLINVNAAYIVLFVPLALLLGIVGERTWHWFMQRHWLVRAAVSLIFGVGLTAAAGFGLHQQLTILNAETILALPPDQDGLEWLADNTPPNARFAVNSFLWLGSTWAGQDGGAWIVPLTGRSSTTPPADYIYDPGLAENVNAFNNLIKSWGTWADPLIADQLREQGVTHVFVGARGGFMDPAELAQNPEMRVLYGRDGTFVFTLRAE